MLYPILQALDEEYLKVDAQFGGVDQRKIFVLAQDLLPKLGYSTRIHLMNPMVPGLNGAKMASSDPASKIDLLDTPAEIKRKLKRAFCEAGNVENNGVLAFAKNVAFPVLEIENKSFFIDRPEKWGGSIEYKSYAELEEDFRTEKLAPQDLKQGVQDVLIRLLRPIRTEFEQDQEWQDILQKAYPQGEKNEDTEPETTVSPSTTTTTTTSPPPPPSHVSSSSSSSTKSKTSVSTQKSGTSNAGKTTVPAEQRPVDCSRLDLRVGQLKEVIKHPSDERLYAVKVDVGESSLRSCVAGLAAFIPAEELINRKCVVVCNLKPSNFKGVLSSAMLLAASQGESTVQLLKVADEASVGERITFEGYSGEPDKELNTKKINLFNKIKPALVIDEVGIAVYRNPENGIASPFSTTVGPVRSDLLNAQIS